MKQYFTGFFTAVCLTASVFIFMGSQNKNLGDIVVNSISVQNDGKEVVWLGTGKGGIGFLETYNADGKQTSYLGTGEGGGGHLSTYNADGKETSYLGTNKDGSGVLMIHNMDEQFIAGFGASPDNGKDGEAIIFDRYGDVGWSASGKQ